MRLAHLLGVLELAFSTRRLFPMGCYIGFEWTGLMRALATFKRFLAHFQGCVGNNTAMLPSSMTFNCLLTTSGMDHLFDLDLWDESFARSRLMG